MFMVPNGDLLVTSVHLLILLFRRRLAMLMQYLSRIDLISKDNRHIFQGLAYVTVRRDSSVPIMCEKIICKAAYL